MHPKIVLPKQYYRKYILSNFGQFHAKSLTFQTSQGLAQTEVDGCCGSGPRGVDPSGQRRPAPLFILGYVYVFYSSVTKKSYTIKQDLDCFSHNHIYLITCKKSDCLWQYVGETGRRHTDRTPEHIHDIRFSVDCPVSIHFRSHFRNPNLAVKNFSIQVIEHCKKDSTQYRKTREIYWQDVLKPQINKINCTNKRHTRSSQLAATYTITPKGKKSLGKK